MLAAPYHARSAWFASAARVTLAFALILAALANIVTVLMTRPWPQAVVVENVIDLDALAWGRTGVIVAGILLLVVARALVRGKRHAWLVAVALLAFSLLSMRVTRHNHQYTLIGEVTLVTLVALAPLFPARSDPRALRRGYLAVILSITTFTVLATVRHVWDPQYGPVLGVPRHLILYLLHGLLFLFLGYGVVEMLRPVLQVTRQQRGEREHALALIQRFATHTTAHFALAPDISYFWSASGQSFVSYRLLRGVALLLGDPVGPADERESLAAAFLGYCRKQDWVMAVYLAGPSFRQTCQRLGMHAYKIGEEAIVATARFSLMGKGGAPVRHAITRARRDGVSARIWQGEAIPETIFAGMKQVSQEWLKEHDSPVQMGFSMGRFPADWSPDVLTLVAFDGTGEVCAFQTWTPLYAGNGWSLDVMRRTAATPPGTTELLIAEAVTWAKQRGAGHMALGLAPLAGLEHVQPPVQAEHERVAHLERGVAFLYRKRLLLANYASLYHFKAKFGPEWEARYLVVSDRSVLPQVLTALLYAQGYRWWRLVRDTMQALRQRVFAGMEKHSRHAMQSM